MIIMDRETEQIVCNGAWDLIAKLQIFLTNRVLREINQSEVDLLDDVLRQMDACVEDFEKLEAKYRGIKQQYYKQQQRVI